MNLLIARRALPLLSPGNRAEAEKLLAEIDAERTGNAAPESLADFTQRAAAVFEEDMQPVCGAIVSALQDGDLAALRGLRAMLPELLRGVIGQPVLGDLLAMQLGQAVVAGMRDEPQRHGGTEG